MTNKKRQTSVKNTTYTIRLRALKRNDLKQEGISRAPK